MRMSTRRTLLRAATGAALVCTAALIFLPAAAAQATRPLDNPFCDISLATGCVVAPEISPLAAR
jgi:hypothetical protein